MVFCARHLWRLTVAALFISCLIAKFNLGLGLLFITQRRKWVRKSGERFYRCKLEAFVPFSRLCYSFAIPLIILTEGKKSVSCVFSFVYWAKPIWCRVFSSLPISQKKCVLPRIMDSFFLHFFTVAHALFSLELLFLLLVFGVSWCDCCMRVTYEPCVSFTRSLSLAECVCLDSMSCDFQIRFPSRTRCTDVHVFNIHTNIVRFDVWQGSRCAQTRSKRMGNGLVSRAICIFSTASPHSSSFVSCFFFCVCRRWCYCCCDLSLSLHVASEKKEKATLRMSILCFVFLFDARSTIILYHVNT